MMVVAMAVVMSLLFRSPRLDSYESHQEQKFTVQIGQNASNQKIVSSNTWLNGFIEYLRVH
jgi:hypothetical protein